MQKHAKERPMAGKNEDCTVNQSQKYDGDASADGGQCRGNQHSYS